MIAQDEPQLVRKLMASPATGPAGGRGHRQGDPDLRILDTVRALLTFTDPKQFLFFTGHPTGTGRARNSWPG